MDHAEIYMYPKATNLHFFLFIVTFHFNYYSCNRFDWIVQRQFLHLCDILLVFFFSFKVSLLFFACFIIRQVKNTIPVTLKHNSMTECKEIGGRYAKFEYFVNPINDSPKMSEPSFSSELHVLISERLISVSERRLLS